jgi:type VI secretion system secreted protein Hcp
MMAGGSITTVMNIPGVRGDVTETGHAGWMRVVSLSWGGKRDVSTQIGSSADRESTAPKLKEISFTKFNDIATGSLLTKFFSGMAQTVEIAFLRTDKTLDSYYKIELTDAILSDYEENSAGDRPVEDWKLSYTKIMITTAQMSADGTSSSQHVAGYDLSRAMAF